MTIGNSTFTVVLREGKDFPEICWSYHGRETFHRIYGVATPAPYINYLSSILGRTHLNKELIQDLKAVMEGAIK